MVNENKKSCLSCGKNVTDDDAVCENCGASLLDQEDFETSVQKVSELIAEQDPSVEASEQIESRNIIAIISMFLGIISVVLVLTLFLCVIGGFIGGIAIILGIIGVMTKRRRGFAIAGILFSVAAFIFLILEFSSILYIYV